MGFSLCNSSLYGWYFKPYRQVLAGVASRTVTLAITQGFMIKRTLPHSPEILRDWSAGSLVSSLWTGPSIYIVQWSSTSLMQRPFSTVPYIVVTPKHKIILLPLHNCNFDTAMNHDLNIWYVGYLICDPQVEKHWSNQIGKPGQRTPLLQLAQEADSDFPLCRPSVSPSQGTLQWFWVTGKPSCVPVSIQFYVFIVHFAASSDPSFVYFSVSNLNLLSKRTSQYQNAEITVMVFLYYGELVQTGPRTRLNALNRTNSFPWVWWQNPIIPALRGRGRGISSWKPPGLYGEAVSGEKKSESIDYHSYMKNKNGFLFCLALFWKQGRLWFKPSSSMPCLWDQEGPLPWSLFMNIFT